MNKLWKAIPPFAGDYSGVCSVLYELNSLNVLYTPGGCSHPIVEVDEIRSFNDMSFYRTDMNDIDVIMGVEDKLIEEVELLLAKTAKVDFVSIIGTPVSSITGVHFEKMAEKLKRKTGIPVVFFNTDGFESYVSGIYDALLKLAERFTLKGGERNSKHVNILGYTPLALGHKLHLDELVQLLENVGVEVHFFASGKSLDIIKLASEAAVNIVISPEGTGVAEYLKNEFHIPYTMDIPVGLHGMGRVLNSLERHLEINFNEIVKEKYTLLTTNTLNKDTNKKVLIIGEPLLSVAIGDCLKQDFNIGQITIASNISDKGKASRIYQESTFSQVVFLENEEDVQRYIRETEIVIADPLYEKFFGGEERKITFIPLPHVGLSGREFAGLKYEYIGRNGFEYFKKYILPQI
ncbi:nitrogenase component 1 [Desulfitibacter alkalitolerans]|uniref:nitrogenase component 1 n=1 Tax=Desulfitibacter alkalitolerans TaxID=264641 RepID=UPI0004810A2B|nr:nitrogenase component 1 [Desulfitibacter alkalitolerans]